MPLLTPTEAAELLPGVSGSNVSASRIAEAEALIATLCGWASLTGLASMEQDDHTNRVLYLDGTAVTRRGGVDVLRLGLFPVSSVASVYDDQDGDLSYSASELVSASDYDTSDLARGELLFLPTGGHTPSRRGYRRFKVTLTAGYATAPDDLKRLIAETTKALIQRHRTAGKTSTSGKSGSASLKEATDLIPEVVQMALYRRYVLPHVLGIS